MGLQVFEGFEGKNLIFLSFNNQFCIFNDNMTSNTTYKFYTSTHCRHFTLLGIR